eukprot:11155852-Prorocentrum_lima.AAC.1
MPFHWAPPGSATAIDDGASQAAPPAKLPGWGGAFFSLLMNADTAGDIEGCRQLTDKPVEKLMQPPPGPKP